jgi:hypothetical protein
MSSPELQRTIRRCTAALVIPISILIGVQAASTGIINLVHHSLKFVLTGWKVMAMLAALYLLGSFAREYQVL